MAAESTSFDQIRDRLDAAHRTSKRTKGYKVKRDQLEERFLDWPAEKRRQVGDWALDENRTAEELRDWVSSGGDPTDS